MEGELTVYTHPIVFHCRRQAIKLDTMKIISRREIAGGLFSPGL